MRPSPAPAPAAERPSSSARACATSATSRATSRPIAPPGEVDELRRTRDCLAAFSRRVTEAGLAGEDDLAGIDASVRRLIDESVERAKAGAAPTPDEVMTDVYVSY